LSVATEIVLTAAGVPSVNRRIHVYFANINCRKTDAAPGYTQYM
jgi:hypothetical protein